MNKEIVKVGRSRGVVEFEPEPHKEYVMFISALYGKNYLGVVKGKTFKKVIQTAAKWVIDEVYNGDEKSLQLKYIERSELTITNSSYATPKTIKGSLKDFRGLGDFRPILNDLEEWFSEGEVNVQLRLIEVEKL